MLAWLALTLCASPVAQGAGDTGAGGRKFAVNGGDAAATLTEFARQSGEQIVFLVDSVRGERTQPVFGVFTVSEAIQQLLRGSRLTVRRDPDSGAMIVAAIPAPPRRAKSRTRVAPDDLGEPLTLPQFTVSSAPPDRYRAWDAVSSVRVRASLLDTPSSISVLTRDAIDDVAPQRLYEITRYVAGVEEGRGTQFADRQIIRGFESNGRTVDNFFQVGADNVDEVIIERVEVSKGPNAILAPAGVPGGSINVITKSPQFTPARSLTATLGRFDAQKLTLDVTGPWLGDRLAYRLVAAAQDSRRYASADARLRGKVFAPMLSWRPSRDTQLTLKLIAAEHWVFREPGLILNASVNDASPSPRLAPGFRLRGRNGIQPWSHVGTRSVDAFLLLTSALTERVALRVAANGRYFREGSTQEFFSTPVLNNRYDPYTGSLTQDHTWALDPALGRYVPTYSPLFDQRAIPVRADTQKTVNSVTQVQADVAARYEFRGFTSQTVAGLALGHMDTVGRVRAGTLPPLDLTQPDRLIDPVWAPQWYGDLRTKQNSIAVYVNQRIGWWQDRVQLTAGLLRFGVVGRSRDHITGSADAHTIDDDRWLGLASVLLKPADSVSLYVTHSNNSTPVLGNNLALWRDGRQHEAGLKFDFFDERLALTIARFEIRQSNVTVPNPDHQTDPSVPEQLISDLGDHGVEIELVGGLTPQLSVIAALTHLHLRDSLGRTVRAVADRKAAVLLSYRFARAPLKGASVYGGLTWTDERAGDATAENFTPLGVPTKHSFIVPPYTEVSLGASYRTGRWIFRLNVENPFNRTGEFQQGGGRVSGTGLTLAPGRNVKLTTTVTW